MNKAIIKFYLHRLYRRVVQGVGRHLFLDNDCDTSKCIFIAGTARSGTTWLAELISSQVPCRLMVEPFHSRLVPEFGSFHYFQYLAAGSQNDILHNFARRVMSGELRNRWIDHKNQRLFPKYRLVKEIRANLFLKWLHDRFPEVPMLLIIRHPCAVVNSRMELKWASDSDIESFLQQPDLIRDFLADKLDLIKDATNEDEKHAIIWSISNLVPLSQFQDNSINIFYYENICTQPEVELPRLFDCVHQKYNKNVLDKVMVPSSTSKLTSAIVTGEDKISRWKQKLTSDQVNRILLIVDSFGLSHLYGDSSLPLNISK